MSSLVLTSHRPCAGGIAAGVLYSALISLGVSSLVSEWSALSGRPALIALDIVVGLLGMAPRATPVPRIRLRPGSPGGPQPGTQVPKLRIGHDRVEPLDHAVIPTARASDRLGSAGPS